MNISYCMKCHKEVGEDIQKCECGSRTFIYGNKDDFKLDAKGVVCNCGSTTYTQIRHLDFTNKAVTIYNCTECCKAFGVEYYRDKKELMLWKD